MGACTHAGRQPACYHDSSDSRAVRQGLACTTTCEAECADAYLHGDHEKLALLTPRVHFLLSLFGAENAGNWIQELSCVLQGIAHVSRSPD